MAYRLFVGRLLPESMREHSLSGAGEVFVSDASKLYGRLSQKAARSVPTKKLEAWLRREGALT
jgi:hypothetical protein